jgi:hypothetical protein
MPVVINGTTGVTTPGTDSTTLTVNANNISAVNSLGFRNRIINGDMRIDQRNAGAAITNVAGTLYSVDRFWTFGSQASKFTAQRNAGSVTPPVGFTNYLGVTSSSAYSVGSSEFFQLYQSIEGLNVADLAWGTANAVTVTLSFWVRSSLTGTFGGSLLNGASNRSYPYSYTISAANTWEQKTITIAGDTSGTWATDNSAGIYLGFNLGSGAAASGTAGSWSSTLYRAPTGATSVVGTSGATFYITGVQLEAGSVASPFERRDYGRELIMCQRYYEIGYTRHRVDPFPSVLGTSASFEVTKRATPTVTATAALGTITGSAQPSTTSVFIEFSAGASGNVAASYTASAEL